MASQLTGRGFWDLVQHILPFYIILLIAYGFARKEILSKIHGPGLARWTSLVGIPIYVGNMLAFSDPYQINLRLVGADALQKAIVLIIAVLWWRFSKHGSIDGVITFFMLATLSNLVLVGPALFEPLHGDQSKVSIATLIILQCALWYNLCIVLFETRVVLKELAQANSVPTIESFRELEKQAQKFPFEKILGTSPPPLVGLNPEAIYGEKNSPSMSPVGRLQRTTSAPARVSFSTARVIPFPAMFLRGVRVDEREGDEALFMSEPSKIVNNSGSVVHEVFPDAPTKAVANPDHDMIEDQSVTIEMPGNVSFEGPRINRAAYVKTVTIKVLNRVKYAPLTYTSIIGFAYSLMAFKWDWEMPYPIKTSIHLVANGAIAISVVVMALTWSDSGRLISCGIKKMTYGFLIRFLIGPVIMMGCSFAFGLKGIAFEFAVLQAALPVGLVSFVLAKEYNLDIDVFSTAVITQLVTFLPLVVLYYFILKPIGV